jgi:hypothetical protein
MFKVKLFNTLKKNLIKNFYLNYFAMRPCNRYIKYNLKYFILK